MRNELRRNHHAELALSLASQDQRLLDLLSQRPYLLNPYPSIIVRLSRRSRRFRLKRRQDGASLTLAAGLRPDRR